MTDEWQPISTAPKDGTCILILNMDYSEPSYNVVFWDKTREYGSHHWCMVEDVGCYADIYPHYWMPLPKPPSEGMKR